MLTFKNNEVAAKYQSQFKGDPVVHQPGGKGKNGFKKKLSEVTLEEADRIYATANQNLLEAKEPGQTIQKSKTIIPGSEKATTS